MGRRVPRFLLATAVAIGLSSTGILVGRMATAERAAAAAPLGNPRLAEPKVSSDGLRSNGRTSTEAAISHTREPVEPRTQPARRRTESPEPRNTLPLEIRIEPACAQRGSSMTATIESIARAQVSIVVAYNDGHSHETYHLGQTDSGGKLVYTWVVHPQAAEGEGVLLAAVGDGERSATGSKNFTVAGPEGCG